MDHRETTREEDKAYALLGIFDVQMPLIYGEGRTEAIQATARGSRSGYQAPTDCQ